MTTASAADAIEIARMLSALRHICDYINEPADESTASDLRADLRFIARVARGALTPQVAS